MRRGEVWLVDFEPIVGSEANKRRPAVIVSNNRANAAAKRTGRGVVTVVPVTSNVARVFAFQVELAATEAGLQVDSKAQAERVRSVAIERFGQRVGTLGSSAIDALDEALRLHLQL